MASDRREDDEAGSCMNDDASAQKDHAAQNDAPKFSCHAAVAMCMNPCAVDLHLRDLDARLRASSPYQLRNDSRLAFQYASGQLYNHPVWPNAEAVVHEMSCLQWLHETTPYGAVLPSALRKLASDVKAISSLRNWSVLWQHVTDYGPDLVRYQMLAQTGLQFPDFQARPVSSQSPPPQTS
jgi:hypothetical protein